MTHWQQPSLTTQAATQTSPVRSPLPSEGPRPWPQQASTSHTRTGPSMDGGDRAGDHHTCEGSATGRGGRSPSRRVAGLLAVGLMASALALSGCDDGGGTDAEVLINSDVRAAEGGTFSSDGPPRVTITVPPGSLDADAILRVERVPDPTPVTAANLAAAGDAVDITLSGGSLSDDQPMKLAIAADTAPSHPQIGEIARLEGGDWRPLSANFFRDSDDTAIGLTSETSRFRPVHRTLQAATGDGVARGEDLFLNETFGNEAFFGDVVGLHTALNALAPADAVAAGVQVNLAKVPSSIVDVLTGNDLAAKQAALQDPAVTRALVAADAVVGVRGEADAQGQLTTAGITCALCHVTVEPTQFELSQGETTPLPIGELRLGGAPNTAMDAGAILALTPFAQSAGQATVDLLNGWGAGNFDIRALPDNPLDDGVDNPTNVPPLWNFVDLAEQGYQLDWDGLFVSQEAPDDALASQAEAVYDLVMHANGAFGTDTGTIPPQLSVEPPQALVTALVQAEADDPGNVIGAQALRDVQTWQRSLVSPAPSGFNEQAAETGFELFYGKANCSGCHSSLEFTGPGLFNITGKDLQGGLAGGIKVAPLRGVSATAPYFHDGSAQTLRDVIDVYIAQGFVPDLTSDERSALVEYLKTL